MDLADAIRVTTTPWGKPNDFPDFPFSKEDWQKWVIFVLFPHKPTKNLDSIAILITIADYLDNQVLDTLLRHYVETLFSHLNTITKTYGEFIQDTIQLTPYHHVSYCYLNLNTTFVAVELSDDELLSQSRVISKLTDWLECYASKAIARMSVFDGDQLDTPYVYFNLSIYGKRVLIVYEKTIIPLSGHLIMTEMFGHDFVMIPSFQVASVVWNNHRDAIYIAHEFLRKKKEMYELSLPQATGYRENKFVTSNHKNEFFFPTWLPGHCRIDFFCPFWVKRIHSPFCPSNFEGYEKCLCRRGIPLIDKAICEFYRNLN